MTGPPDAATYSEVMASPQEHRLDPTQLPKEFQVALSQITAARLRPEVTIEEMPAPQRIAPYATAMSAEVVVGDDEVAGGRLVVLHDPRGNDAWGGDFRCVAYVRAEVEPSMASDDMLAAVGWSWLVEALASEGAQYIAPSGTVTCVNSASFGALAKEDPDAQIEIRASWTPTDSLTAHVQAWANVMCEAAGLPPVPEGVAVLPRSGNRKR